MAFSRPEYWSGYPFPSQGYLPNQGIKPRSCSLPAEPQRSPRILKQVPYPFSSGSSQPRNSTGSPALQADSLTTELSGKPRTWRIVNRECEVKGRVWVGYSAWVKSGEDYWGPSRVGMSGGTSTSGFFSWYIEHVCSMEPCLPFRALSCNLVWTCFSVISWKTKDYAT